MKRLLFIMHTCIMVSCATSDKKSNELNGNWHPIRQEIAGTDIPATAFENQTLNISDSTYTMSAESVDKGVLSYKDGKMDIYGKDGVNAGKHFTAIYKLDKGQLTICYNLAGDSYPEKFETQGKQTLFLSVFKK
jgi:uncharacterized protein (TIGR03067 family)